MLSRSKLDNIGGGIATALFLAWILMGSAKSQEPPQIPGSPIEQQTNGPAENKEPPQQQPSNRDSRSAVGGTEIDNNQNTKGNRDTHQGADEGTEFWTILGHRLKITDTLLSVFTFFLVLVTGGLIWVGGRQEWWMRKHERAYVIAGPGDRERDATGRATALKVTAGNYGRTPAILKEITYGLCPVGKALKYPPFQIYEDVLYPSMTRKSVYTIRLPATPISGTTKQIFFGRIVYNDIFGREHFSSWKHEVAPDAERNTVGLKGCYSTGWDRTRWHKKTAPP